MVLTISNQDGVILYKFNVSRFYTTQNQGTFAVHIFSNDLKKDIAEATESTGLIFVVTDTIDRYANKRVFLTIPSKCDNIISFSVDHFYPL